VNDRVTRQCANRRLPGLDWSLSSEREQRDTRFSLRISTWRRWRASDGRDGIVPDEEGRVLVVNPVYKPVWDLRAARRGDESARCLRAM